MSTWTWEMLTTTDTAALKDLMRTGETPDPAAIEGRTYEGLNRGLVPRGARWLGLHVAYFVLRYP